jgi:hypothetical protein
MADREKEKYKIKSISFLSVPTLFILLPVPGLCPWE